MVTKKINLNEFRNLVKQIIKEDFDINSNINNTFINSFAEELKNKDGVLDVDISNVEYDNNGNVKFYNNVIRVIFEDTSFYGFKLEKFNTHDANADADKFLKHLESSNIKLDSYLQKINKIKDILPKIKNVVDYVNNLNLETNINIKKIGFSYWTNQLKITIYKQ